MITDLELSELLAVKLCHDLSGPIGAVNNGTELLKEGNDDIYERSLELVEGSAKDAVARILLYRQAYGTSQNDITISSLSELTDNFFASSNVEVNWPREFSGAGVPQSAPGDFAKIVLILILITSRTMVYGGKIAVRPQRQNGKNMITIRGEGKVIKLDEEVKNILTDKKNTEKITVKNVQAYLVSRISSNLDLEINIEIGDDFIEVIGK